VALLVTNSHMQIQDNHQTARCYKGCNTYYRKCNCLAPFVVAETLVDRRHLCGSGYTPCKGVYSMLYINILCTNITIQNILQYCLII